MAKNNTKATMGATALLVLSLSCASCSSMKSVFSADSSKDAPQPIGNPFTDYIPGPGDADPRDSMIFRSKRGDKAVEVEIPRANQDVTDFVLPAPGKTGSRGLASVGSSGYEAHAAMEDRAYTDQAPTASDRELTREFSKVPVEDEKKRSEIESGLGLVTTEEMTPERQKSYLASIDRLKQLYRGGRYEAGLLEADSLIRDFPTDPRLHQMRGTLLERLGRSDLAMKSWMQALRFDPKNESLRRFIERRGGRLPTSEQTEVQP